METWKKLANIQKNEQLNIVAELSEKLAKSGLYTSKGEEVEELARKLKVEIRKIKAEDRERVKKILSRGESLSKMVIRARGS